MARYYKDFDAIRNTYQQLRDGYCFPSQRKTVPLYSLNDLVGVRNWEDQTFDWFRYDDHLGHLQTGSTWTLPEGAHMIGGE